MNGDIRRAAPIVERFDVFDVQAGDRVLIGRGVYHGFETAASPLRFLSVQSPPILDESTGQIDLEPR